MDQQTIRGLDAIIDIKADDAKAFVPPLSDYVNPSKGWAETEFRCFERDAPAKTFVGYWQGEPGEVSFDAWPYDEICSILEGEVGVRDEEGRVRRFSTGSGFVIPRGWKGTWITFTHARKIFVAVD